MKYPFHFREPERKALLDALQSARNALLKGSQHSLMDDKPVHKACQGVIEEIDKLAGLLTGDKTHFHGKSLSSSSLMPQKDQDT